MTTKLQAEGLGEFARMGFTLGHPDDHVVVLYHEGEEVATFSQLGAKPEELQKECALHLIQEHRWDGAIWKGADRYGS